jgi:alpha-L-fucosidase
MTMNDTWGYKTFDQNWKSANTLVRTLIDTSSKGGNFLLNVGPTAEGLIPGASVERLAAMGRWLRVNGEAIYGSGPSPIAAPSWGRVTSRPGRLYLHVYEWPASKVLEVAIAGAPKRAWLLSDPARASLPAKVEGGTLKLTLPDKAPDPIASVVALEL